MSFATRPARPLRLMLLVGLWAAPAASLATPPAATRGPAPLTPAHALRPLEGYYDDAFALDATGQRLAVVRTDGAAFTKLEVIDVGSGQTKASFDLGESDQIVDGVEVLDGDKGFVLTVRDAINDRRSAVLLDGSGRRVAKTATATAFHKVELSEGKSGPEPVIVAMDKVGKVHPVLGGEITYAISAYRLPTLAPVGKPHLYRVGATGDLRGTDLEVVGFYDGYSKILGQRAGAYDKKQDFRRPGRIVVYDAVTGKVASESEINDVYAWARTSKLRQAKPNRTTFVQLNQDQTGVEVIDPAGKILPLPLAVPFRLYDHKTLQDQEGPEKGIYYVALAIDPLNPDAIARQKADTAALDLYAVNLATQKSSHRGRILLPRSVSWKVGFGKLVVLKRFKSFTRGGDELAIYNLP